jgi:monoamine oxidase
VLAGAWTDTGWPATMEGAVRSGQAAAREALKTVSSKPEVGAAVAA